MINVSKRIFIAKDKGNFRPFLYAGAIPPTKYKSRGEYVYPDDTPGDSETADGIIADIFEGLKFEDGIYELVPVPVLTPGCLSTNDNSVKVKNKRLI